MSTDDAIGLLQREVLEADVAFDTDHDLGVSRRRDDAERGDQSLSGLEWRRAMRGHARAPAELTAL
jgi:hypothetical protein